MLNSKEKLKTICCISNRACWWVAEAEKQFLHHNGRCIWELLRMQSHPESKKEQGIVNNIRITHLYTKLEMTKSCMLYHFKQEAWLTVSTFGTDHKVSVLFFWVVQYVLSCFQMLHLTYSSESNYLAEEKQRRTLPHLKSKWDEVAHRDCFTQWWCTSSPVSFPFKAPSPSQSSAGRHRGADNEEEWRFKILGQFRGCKNSESR